MFFFETYLDWRQHKRFDQKKRTKELESLVSQEDFIKSQAYGHDKSSFGFVRGTIDHVLSVLMLWYRVYPLMWEWAGSIVAHYVSDFGPEYEVSQSLVFVYLFYFVTLALSTPFSIYNTFVIEEKHGFNKTDAYTFVTDILKQIGLVLFFGTLILPPFIWIIKWGGDYFYLYIWGFCFLLQLFLITIFPTYIQPLFNKVEELEKGSLRDKIEALATSTNFPLTKLFKIDGSKRSGHSNAYFYGFFKNKRIVLYDTLIEQSTEEEVVAVLGHELGHYFLNHTIQGLVISQINLLSMFYLYGYLVHNPDLFTSFGFSSQAVIISFILFNFVYSPISHVLQFLMNMWSRHNEFQADAFSVKLGYAKTLESGLIKLQTNNKSAMTPDPWYSTYHYSHPPLVERLKAIKGNKKD